MKGPCVEVSCLSNVAKSRGRQSPACSRVDKARLSEVGGAIEGGGTKPDREWGFHQGHPKSAKAAGVGVGARRSLRWRVRSRSLSGRRVARWTKKCGQRAEGARTSIRRGKTQHPRACHARQQRVHEVVSAAAGSPCREIAALPPCAENLLCSSAGYGLNGHVKTDVKRSSQPLRNGACGRAAAVEALRNGAYPPWAQLS